MVEIDRKINKVSKITVKKGQRREKTTFLSIWGKVAMRWSSNKNGDWPKRTGEEEEQRIRFEEDGDGISSKIDDLFPHTIADILWQKTLT